MILRKYPSKEDFIKLALQYNVIPVCAEILADTETPVSILQKFHSHDKSESLSRKDVDKYCISDDSSEESRDSRRAIFLLESVEGGEHWARYSFMGLSAKSHVKVYSDHVVIEENYQNKDYNFLNTKEQSNDNFNIKDNQGIIKIYHNGEPLSILKKLSSMYKPADIKELPRFWSGLTGYITYEMVSFFEEISSMLPENKPYAHFVIPDAMIIFDNMNHTLTCMSICYIENGQSLDGSSNSSKIDIEACYNESCKHLEKIIERINAPVLHKTSTQLQVGEVPKSRTINSQHLVDENSNDYKDSFSLTPVTDHDKYIQGVIKIKEHIVAGDIIQAVYSQPFVSNTLVDPVLLYRTQRYINPSPYMFFMDFGDIAIAGSSPETMVRLENRTATLRPIAGTRARGKNEQEDRTLADELLNDEKERAEHLMLVDLGRNDLGRVAEIGTVQVTDLMFVERYSHVMHLVSNITCEVKQEFDAWDLLRATFPAGTLSGAPKIRAMEIISDIEENRPRGIYGGAAGYISFSGNMDLAITIRTAIVENSVEIEDNQSTNKKYSKTTVQAGAGIVYDSDPEREYQECINKAKSVERALRLALMNSNCIGGLSC